MHTTPLTSRDKDAFREHKTKSQRLLVLLAMHSGSTAASFIWQSWKALNKDIKRQQLTNVILRNREFKIPLLSIL